MSNIDNIEEEVKETEAGEVNDIRMSNFSMIIAIVFVTLVMVFLFVKIMFD